MKIIILHGDDTQKSYKRLTKFIDVAKKRHWEISYIDEDSTSFRETVSATSLFGNERFFILKNIKKLGEKDIEWLKKNHDNLAGNLILYSDSVLNVKTLKSFSKDSKIEEFKLPVLLWSFLDGMFPGQGDQSVRKLHKIVEKQPVEFVFFQGNNKDPVLCSHPGPVLRIEI